MALIHNSETALEPDVARAALSPAGAIRIYGAMVLEAAAADKQGPRRFSGVLYAGGPLRVPGYPLPIVLDLAGLEGTDKPRPFYREHDDSKIVGHLDAYQNNGRQLAIEGALSRVGADAVEVAQMYDDGFPWQQSIEALPEARSIVSVPAGQSITVNGRTLAGPLFVARRARLIGASVVSRGADDNSTFAIAAHAAPDNHAFFLREGATMQFEKWLEAMGLVVKDLTEQQQKMLTAKFDAEQAAVVKASADATGANGTPAAAAIVAVPGFDADEIRAVYAEHEATIEAAFAEAEPKIETQKLAGIRATGVKAATALRRQALTEKWAAPRLEAALVKAAADVRVELVRAERPVGPAIHSSTRDMSAPVIEAALCRTAGYAGLEKAYPAQVLESAEKQFRNLGIQELVVLAAMANGYCGRPIVRSGNLREILEYAFPVRGAASFSTLSLPGLLGNVANKFLLEGFQNVEQSWREISNVRSVPDFKQMTAYRLLDDMAYEQLSPAGEIRHGKTAEESYTNQAKTYAKMYVISRENIINDDTGAFDTMRQRIGRGAGIKLNRIFWTSFLDNASFFSAARGNLITTVLGLAGLAAAVLALDNQTDGEGNPIESMGSILLVPPALHPTAQSLYVSTEVRDTSASTKIPTANIYRDTYRPVKSKYITTSYGGAATQWFLIADPTGGMGVMEVAFLDGQQSPTVESAECDFDTLGIQLRGYHDFGVAKKEFRAGVKSTGAG
jgi:hypothetical protein